MYVPLNRSGSFEYPTPVLSFGLAVGVVSGSDLPFEPTPPRSGTGTFCGGMRLGPKTSGSRDFSAEPPLLPKIPPPPPSFDLHPASASSAASPAAQADRWNVRGRGFVAVILTRLRGRLHQRGVRRPSSPPVLSPTDCPPSTRT